MQYVARLVYFATVSLCLNVTVLAERTTSEWTEDAVFLPLLAAISNVVTNHLKKLDNS